MIIREIDTDCLELVIDPEQRRNIRLHLLEAGYSMHDTEFEAFLLDVYLGDIYRCYGFNGRGVFLDREVTKII